LNLMIDLFSGLGGASEAFFQDSRWDVMRVDNNHLLEYVPNTMIAPVEEVKIDLAEISNSPRSKQVDFLWASPPCVEFSRAYGAPGPSAQRRGDDFVPSLKNILDTIEIIESIKPRFWCIENVRGAIPHLKDILGEPRQIIGPYVFWGNYPLINTKLGDLPTKASKNHGANDPLRANKMAKIPFEISAAFLDAISSQKTLWYFYSNIPEEEFFEVN